ncbi:hypothetical protein OG777_10145 [Micromonospora peucetia]|uniref:hypothetical protein n=1 Tax=Micromonospora peucetia TaxID=47871 RepID=UPI002253A802|nr:hypothetical protein [Micromonospora peucetia]MCX4387292.1 hypothetical protein [Micromonospora peucetia]
MTQPLTAQTLAVALTVAAWLVWLMLAATVTIRAAARARAGARWLRRIPLPTPLQATATGMAGAAAFGAGAHTGATSAGPEAPLPVAAGTLDRPTGADGVERPDGVSEVGDASGVVVRGGWLPWEVAEQVAAAAGLVWLRRRRTYQPHPPHDARDDTDLAPLPETVTAIQTALTAPTPPAPTTGTAPAGPAGSIASLPSGRIALTGPGALAAARGMLVTAALAGLRHPAASAPLVITRAAARTLLGADIVRPLPGVRVAGSVNDAVAFLASSAAALFRSGWEDAGRPVLILESAPQSGPLAVALAACAATAMFLGAGTAEVTWHVDGAGHTHDPQRPDWVGPRLCVLDPVAATDLLTVITQAHPPDVHPGAGSRPVTVTAPERSRIPRQARGARHSHPPARAVAGRLDLRVLGEPTLIADGTPVPIRRSAALQVLVFLAVHPEGASSQQIVEAIWPGLPAHRLTGRLYTTLSDLRTTVRAACGLAVIDHTDNRYRLNPGFCDVDLWRLRTLAAHAATAVTSTATDWQAVIGAYTSDLAVGHQWPWLDPAREATRRHVLDAYAALAATEPDPRRALDFLQAGIRVDPYNQALHQQATGILTALGEHDTATELADTYHRRLTAAGLPPTDAHHPALHDGAEPVSGR